MVPMVPSGSLSKYSNGLLDFTDFKCLGFDIDKLKVVGFYGIFLYV